MGELSRSFSAGKMNKDLDERLVPPGEYRDAQNIEIVTSEGSAVGTVQNIKGNTQKDPGSAVAGATSTAYGAHEPAYCLATIKDEKNNKIYSFIHDGPWHRIAGSIPAPVVINSNYILEYDVSTDAVSYIINDITTIDGYTSALTSGSGNQITMANNVGVRAGMILSIAISSITYKVKVKHTYANDSGSTTPSATLVFLEENIPAHGANVAIQFWSSEQSKYGDLLKWTPTTKITGINILDDFIFWTDNETEPKKINISRCKAGTGNPGTSAGDLTSNTLQTGADRIQHTRLFAEIDTFKDLQCITSDDGTIPIYLKEEHITVIKKTPLTPPVLEMSAIGLDRTNTVTGVKNDTHAQITLNMGIDDPNEGFVSLQPGNIITVGPVSTNNVDWREGDLILATEETPDDPNFITDGTVLLKVISSGPNPPSPSPNTLHSTYDLEVASIASGVTTGLQTWYFCLKKPDTIFANKFVRFAYRYKYSDGEYSPYSPFSELAFLPGPYNWKASLGYNTGMSNILRGLKIKNYLPKINERPQDVVAIDILYKDEISPNIYTVKTLNKQDGNSTGSTPLVWPDTTVTTYANKRGEYEITSEMIHAVLPSNQLLRPYDNIPRKAIAQELVGNRIVYANYLQNYNIENTDGEIKPEFELGFKSTRINLNFTEDYTVYLNLAGESAGANPSGIIGAIINNILENGVNVPAGATIIGEPKTSVKSLRTYQVGVVYLDPYGRQTPVLTDKATGSLNIPKEFSSKQNKISVTIKTPPPDWASHYKYYIKETSNEYYNLAMDRWYDADDGNVWISFPSADRNKVDEETYLILKKAQGTTDSVVKPAKYKILTIENEPPTFIKTVQYNLGNIASSSASNYTNITDYPAAAGDGYPVKDASVFKLDADAVNARFGVDENGNLDLIPLVQDSKVYIRFTVNDNSKSSKFYRVGKIAKNSSGDTDEHFYEITVDTKFEEDIDFLGSSSSATAHNISFTKREIQDSPEFDGKFFVKLQRDQVLEDNALVGVIGEDYLIKHTRPIRHTSGAINFDKQYSQWSTSSYIGAPTLTTDGGSEPDNHHYYFKGSVMNIDGSEWVDDIEVAVQGEGAAGSLDSDNNNAGTANNTGEGYYAPIPWASKSYKPANGGTYEDKYSVNRDEEITREEDYFDNNLDGVWAIDNENSANGSAGRGICKDAQGKVFANVIGTDWYKPGFGSERVNDNARILFDGVTDSAWNKSGDNGRSGVNNGTNQYPSDIYSEAEHNVMHLSYFGIPNQTSGGDSETIVGNSELQHEWEFQKALTTIGTIFRWQDDPDGTKYQITRVHEQTGIRNFESDSTKGAYNNRVNKRIRYTIKFKNLETGEETGFGHNTTNQFHPLVNAVNESGTAVVTVTDSNITKDSNGNAVEAYNFAGLAPDASNYLNLQILEPYYQYATDEKADNPEPAVFETEPKEDADLDIYYEASQAFPLEVTKETNELLIPVGSTFILENSDYNGLKADGQTQTQKDPITFTITEWKTKSDGNPGFIATPTGEIGDNQVDAGETIQIITPYGNEVSVELDDLMNETRLESTGVGIKGGPSGGFSPHSQKTYLGWYNCIAFGNGVESDRIRDDFGRPTISNGVKASSTLAERYREERRKTGLIYSGIYNSKSGVNNLNQFIAGEKITKDLNPDYGSIQKIYQRDGDLLALCEDKILTIVANKDAIFNADGNPQLIASDKVLGQAVPLGGEYGISTNPESFANYASNIYFTDTQRGSVIQIKGNSLVPISQVGMADYFADNLKDANLTKCIGSYDEKKSEYNLTLVDQATGVYGSESSTTISYSEKAQGWTSFKTFIPQQGISLNNKYYTWYKGSMWEHHSNDTYNSFYSAITAVVDGAVSSTSTVSLQAANERIEVGMFVSGTGVTANTTVQSISAGSSSFVTLSSAQTISDGVTLTFTHVSSITPIFNDTPHHVKSFGSLAYEGSQSRVIENDSDTDYYNIDSSTGWYCESITTNKQEGEVPEFVEKEGRWYNYVRGVTTTLSNLDTSEISVQGIGKPNIESYSSTGNFTYTFQDTAGAYPARTMSNATFVPLQPTGLAISGSAAANSTFSSGVLVGRIVPDVGVNITPQNIKINQGGTEGITDDSPSSGDRTIEINEDADGSSTTNTLIEKVELSQNAFSEPDVLVKVFFLAVTPSGDATITFDFD